MINPTLRRSTAGIAVARGNGGIAMIKARGQVGTFTNVDGRVIGQEQIDPSLIGGFVLEFDNKRYDASVASKLNDLKSDFNKNQYVREF